ncbi:MAG: hypothetical protein M3336_02450, partial [Chloroflexota bacterium]|nr:hypothetical protein [Chloroflexota bacterium]
SGASAHEWTTLFRSEVRRRRDLPSFAEDVVAYEGAVAELALSQTARRAAQAVAHGNRSLSQVSSNQLRFLAPVLGDNVRIEHYAHNAPAIVSAIQACDRLQPVAARVPTVVLLVLSPDEDEPHPFLINDSVEAVLLACDGTTDCAGIARQLGVEADGELERSLHHTLESLRVHNILTYREPDQGSHA